MDAHTRRKSREIENSLNSNSSRLNYDLTAFLSQMFYACKTLKTTRISAEQIRENWQPNYCRPSQLELAEYLDAALASKQVYLIDGKYVFICPDLYAFCEYLFLLNIIFKYLANCV